MRESVNLTRQTVYHLGLRLSYLELFRPMRGRNLLLDLLLDWGGIFAKLVRTIDLVRE